MPGMPSAASATCCDAPASARDAGAFIPTMQNAPMTDQSLASTAAPPADLLTLVVDRRVDDRGDIMRLDLVAPDGADLPPFEAGAHVDVHVDVHVDDGEVHLVRQYSLCGDPADRSRYRLGILDDPQSRGGSRALHRLAQLGTRLTVGTPRNLFGLDAQAPETVLVGGGIGVTPLLAMAHALHGQGRRFTLHYCTRTRARTAFLDEIEALAFRDKIVLHFDDDGPLVPERDLPPASAGGHLYTCGPSGFMDFVISSAQSLGYGTARIHREYFNAEVDESGAGFEVEAARSGVRVHVAEGVSIAAALKAAGVAVNLSCESGVCGTCLVDVLDGIPDHRDKFLTDEEREAGDQMLICCSRARGAKLVLDI